MIQGDILREESKSEHLWDGESLLQGVGLMACRGKVLGDCTGLMQYDKMRIKYH